MLFVEMNDLESFLRRVRTARRFTEVVEKVSVEGNREFPQYWTSMLVQCRRIVEEAKKWMDAVDADVEDAVLGDAKTKRLMESGVWREG